MLVKYTNLLRLNARFTRTGGEDRRKRQLRRIVADEYHRAAARRQVLADMIAGFAADDGSRAGRKGVCARIAERSAEKGVARDGLIACPPDARNAHKCRGSPTCKIVQEHGVRVDKGA